MKKIFLQNLFHVGAASRQQGGALNVPHLLGRKPNANQSAPQKYCGFIIMAAALLLGSMSLSIAQTQNLLISSFDTGTQGSTPSGCGIWYGSSTATWDGTQDITGNGGGSLYITCPDDSSSDTPLNPYICMNGGNPWYIAGSPVDLTQYKSIDFDIKWDNTSALTIDQWNQPSTWPASFGGPFPGSDPANGFNIKAVCDGNGTFVQLGVTNIPDAASNGWVHMSFPIDPSIGGIGTCNGIDFEKWIANSGSIVGSPTVHFWIDNVELIGTAGPPPPPTINAPTKTSDSGLAIYASTEGNSYYDRQSVLFTTNAGTSWMSSGVTYPVSYSFTIADFPTDPATYGCEAWLFLSPNPAAIDNAPDWNETNMVIAFVQLNTNGATMHFQYKVNEDHQQAMYSGSGPDTRAVGTNTYNLYYSAPIGSMPGGPITNEVSPGVYNVTNESGDLASLVNPAGADGTWTIRFTSANNVTLTAPGGATTNVVIPSYNASFLAPGATGMNIYLGMQANNAAAINQKVVYSNFAISGGAPTTFSDNFAADTTLNTAAWATAQATGPGGIFIIKPGWLFTWSLPDAGFSPQVSSGLTNTLGWTTPANSSPFSLYKMDAQIVSGSDLPAGGAAFFRLIKRTYTQLQVLWPGQTNAPNTANGYTGTAAPVTNGDYVTVTINACDNTWHIVNTTGDQIQLTSDTAIVGNNVNLLNGTTTNVVVWTGPTSGATVTATDITQTNIPPATSSPINVN
jgi:hypothetical protein